MPRHATSFVATEYTDASKILNLRESFPRDELNLGRTLSLGDLSVD